MNRLLGLILPAFVLAACSGEVPVPSALPLLDRWSQVTVDRPTPPPPSPPEAEIRFDGSGLPGVRWRAVDGVADLRVENGRLWGRTTSATPMILLESPAPLGVDDKLWSVAVRLQASAGEKIGIHPVAEQDRKSVV